MKNLGQLMKQAQQVQQKMQDMQNELAGIEIEGAAGGGMVKVTLNGKSEVKRVKIEPSMLNPSDVEIIEDLIVAAFNDAKGKVESRVQEEMKKITGGLQLPPGMNLPF
ncbi:MAG: YbaB/EbfC family nucleoid-associated protein [Alphaproteobacteria bacterium]